jgi:predicted 3-demethylubiquinone-9 3-methyltransferase (glyoxalase superfamily)
MTQGPATPDKEDTDMQKITPCLWFDGQAEEAVAFYTAIFSNSRIVSMTWYGEGGMRSTANRRKQA